jgi:hypothetical protein
VVLFAGFYVEANLNHIVRALKLRNQFKVFMDHNRHPGLQDKLAWFYNDFVSPHAAPDLQSARKQGINRIVDFRESRRGTAFETTSPTVW